MEDFTRFRAALNGFNRADVCGYIESSAQEHQQVVRALRQEIQQLQSENGRMARELLLLRADMVDYEELAARESSRAQQDWEIARERSLTMSRVRDLCQQTAQFWTAARAMLEETETMQTQTARQAAGWTARFTELVDRLGAEAVMPGVALAQDLEGQTGAAEQA